MGLLIKAIISFYTVGFFSINPFVVSDKHIIQDLHLDWRDTTTSIKDNFYLYANGNWLKNTTIPPGYFGISTAEIANEEVISKMHKIILDLLQEKKEKLSENDHKIIDFYLSGIDEKTINKLGITPLNSDMALIDSIKNKRDVSAVVAKLHLIGVNIFFSHKSMKDDDSDSVIGSISKGKFIYHYDNEDEFARQVCEDRVRYITSSFELLGEAPEQAKKSAAVVKNIDEILVKSISIYNNDDYRITTVSELEHFAPLFDWKSYFSNVGLSGIESVHVQQRSVIYALNSILETTSIDNLKKYLKLNLFQTYLPFLSNDYHKIRDVFYADAMGIKKPYPRWEIVLRAEDDALGYAIGELYSKKYSSLIVTIKISRMVNQIKGILRRDIHSLTWMTADKKKEAIKKLDGMTTKISHPNKIIDYSQLDIKKDTYLLNNKNANYFRVKSDLDKIGKKIDISYWVHPPQKVSPWYSSFENAITLPLGFISPSVFNPQSSDAITYGVTGFIIGHEITHAFSGFAVNPVKCITAQFSQYSLKDILKVNGSLVANEAMADLGGVMLAYRAFHESDEYKSAKTINGLTPDQQFFLSFAHAEAQLNTPEKAYFFVLYEPHPLAMHRVNGTLANMPEFQKAFNIPDRSPMVNENRCVVW